MTIYCIGGFSDEAPEFREDIDVDDECEDFVRVVPENCRYLLRGALLENFGYLDVLCDGYCSNVVYLFYSKCDERTEQDNSTELDFLCANNNDDKQCGDEVISELLQAIRWTLVWTSMELVHWNVYEWSLASSSHNGMLPVFILRIGSWTEEYSYPIQSL